jgi:hypothetical protein
MTSRLLLIAAALCWALAPGLARATDMRFPQTGNPALSFHMPDDWTSQVDSDGNLIIVSGAHDSSIAMSVVTVGPEEFDQLAAEIMKAANANPPQRIGPVTVSGFSGFDYSSTMSNASGVAINLKLIIVRPDPNHIASVTLITVQGISSEGYAAGQGVIDSLGLTAGQ